MKNKLVIKIIISIIVLVTIGLCSYLIQSGSKSNNFGEITIIIIDENNRKYEEKFDFNKSDSLFDVLKRNYNNDDFKYNDGPYGAYITKLKSLEEINELTYIKYISFLVNDEYSTYGISMLELNDKDIITFSLHTYNYE